MKKNLEREQMHMKIFDTHAHYSDEKYDIDRIELFHKMYNEGIDKIALIGSNIEDSKKEKELAISSNKLDNVPRFYFVVGAHPDDVPKYSPMSLDGVKYLDEIKSLTYINEKIEAVAIGEIGLDYHGDFKNEDDYKNQKEWFIAQMELARNLNIPMVVHSRDACKDTYDLVKEYGKGIGGIIHCFSYEKEIALDYVKLGYHIGIGGTLTFKNARKVKEVVDAVDIENIVTETDSPYLAPMPYRGERNESTYIKYVVEKIARIKNRDIDYVYETLYTNALNVYKIK